MIYAADPDYDWTSSATWEKANPAFNVTVMEDFYAQECVKARTLPSYENTFRRLTESNTAAGCLRMPGTHVAGRCPI